MGEPRGAGGLAAGDFSSTQSGVPCGFSNYSIYGEATLAPGADRAAPHGRTFDYGAGALNQNGATGGPVSLATAMPNFFVGINDPLGGNPHGTPFTPVIFTLFNAWANQPAQNNIGDLNSRRASH